MKKENLGLGIVFVLLICTSFFAGYKMSSENTNLAEKNERIRQLEEVIVQQQIVNQYMIKSMPQFKIKNWAMNKNK